MARERILDPGTVVPIQPPKSQAVRERKFSILGDGHFEYTLTPAGIVFEVAHLRRESRNLVGELTVKVNGNFPEARTIRDGVLLWGDMNFSAVETRSRRAKLLSERSQASQLDWHGYLEDFAYQLFEREKKGHPSVVLADVEVPLDYDPEILIGKFPLLRELPMVLFGDNASGKSYFAMWLAASLALQGVPVLYADWEFAATAHKQRLQKLFAPMPKNLRYVRCDRPLKDELDHISMEITKHHCGYLICDSIGWALDGPAESQEAAATYFRATRQLKIGSMHIAHIPKPQEGAARKPEIFGSTFFRAGARSAWFVEKATENPAGELRIGLHQRKNQDGLDGASLGYSIHFDNNRTWLESVDINSVDELAAQLPLLTRVKRFIRENGAKNVKELSEELDATQATIRALLSKHKSQFLRVNGKVAIRTDGLDF